MKNIRKTKSNTRSHLSVGAKQWIHVDIHSGIMNIGDYGRWEDGGANTAKLSVGYSVHHLGDRYTKIYACKKSEPVLLKYTKNLKNVKSDISQKLERLLTRNSSNDPNPPAKKDSNLNRHLVLSEHCLCLNLPTPYTHPKLWSKHPFYIFHQYY